MYLKNKQHWEFRNREHNHNKGINDLIFQSLHINYKLKSNYDEEKQCERKEF